MALKLITIGQSRDNPRCTFCQYNKCFSCEHKQQVAKYDDKIYVQTLPKETPRQAQILEKYSPQFVETPRRRPPALEPIVTVNKRDTFKSKSRPQSPCGCDSEEKLKQEIKRRLKSEQLAQLEIGRLRKELEELKNKSQLKPKVQYAPPNLHQQPKIQQRPEATKPNKPRPGKRVLPPPQALDHLNLWDDNNYNKKPPKRSMARPREDEDDTEERIRQIKAQRLHAERQAQIEIDRLNREVELLKTRPPPQPRIRQLTPEPFETYPTYKDRTPPLAPITKRNKSPPQVQPTPQPINSYRSITPEKKNTIVIHKKPVSQNPVLDLLKRHKNAVDKIGHGEGPERKTLNDQTKNDLKIHKIDLEAAEKELFGHPMRKRDWTALNDTEKKKRSEEILEIVRRRMENRFKQTGKF